MRRARVLAVVASGLVALGLVQAPSLAAPTEERLSRTELGEVATAVDRGHMVAGDGWAGGPPRRVDVVTDPTGDADGGPGGGGAGPSYARLAELTRARYRTPSRVDGDLRITTRWARLVDGRRPGVRRQTQVTIVFGRTNRHLWGVEVNNASDQVSVVRIGRERNTPVRPERVSVERDFGPGGRTDILLSAEWIDTGRVAMYTYAYGGDHLDRTDESARLTVGPVR